MTNMTIEEFHAEMNRVADLYLKAHKAHWDYVRSTQALGEVIDYTLSAHSAFLREPANQELYDRMVGAYHLLCTAWTDHRPPDPAPAPISVRMLKGLPEQDPTQKPEKGDKPEAIQ